MLVHAFRLPLLEGVVVEQQRLTIAAPVEVAIPSRLEVRQSAVFVEELAAAQVKDISLDDCGRILLPLPAPCAMPAAHCEDVVANRIARAGGVHDPAGEGVVHDVVLDEHPVACLVQVNAPGHRWFSHVRENVVDQIVAQHAARLRAEGVDASAIAQHTADHVVDVIVLGGVVVGPIALVAPVPADGHAGIVEAVNFVMGDSVLAALRQPDANTFRIHFSAIVNVVV